MLRPGRAVALLIALAVAELARAGGLRFGTSLIAVAERPPGSAGAL